MTEPLSPEDDLRVVNALIYNIPNTPALGNIHGGAARARELLTLLKAVLAAPVVVFRWRGDDGPRMVFEIGLEGLPLRTVKTTCRGVWAVWWCLDNPREKLPTTDLADPAADTADASVRRQIRKTAAKQFADWGMAHLESAALVCTVGAGVIEMQLPVNAPRFITQ